MDILYYKTGEFHIGCDRCGFFKERMINEGKSKFPEQIVYKYEEGGGTGAFNTKSKGPWGCTGSINRKDIKKIKKHASEYSICRYTYKRNGRWFIRDLITKKTLPFSYENFYQHEKERKKYESTSKEEL